MPLLPKLLSIRLVLALIMMASAPISLTINSMPKKTCKILKAPSALMLQAPLHERMALRKLMLLMPR